MDYIPSKIGAFKNSPVQGTSGAVNTRVLPATRGKRSAVVKGSTRFNTHLLLNPAVTDFNRTLDRHDPC